MNPVFLKKRKVKEILSEIKDQWGCDFPDAGRYAFCIGERDNIFMIDKSVEHLTQEHLRINRCGLYIAEYKNGLRLSMEGTCIVGPHATKNVVDLSEEEARQWMQGEDIHKSTDATGFAILRYHHDYLGCGRVKEGKILNYVPKNRRVTII